jgi:hypothetical protein
MCAALPRSDYYGHSAPRSRRRRAWSACRLRGARVEVLVFRRWTLGALGGRLYPWQRGQHVNSGYDGCVLSSGAHPARHLTFARALVACPSPTSRRFLLHTEDSNADFTLHDACAPCVVRHGTCGSLPINARASSQAVQTARLLQVAVPISATFAVPFFIRPEPDEDDFVLGHRSTSSFHDALRS